MSRLEDAWRRRGPLALLLLPLAALFAGAAAIRRRLFRAGLLRARRLPVPVIVVGNIAVGGTGKTPLVLWLAAALAHRGWRPGIVTRGYRGTARVPQAVPAEGDARRYGDEAVLLAARRLGPVWIGRDRTAAARGLLASHPECDVIVSDDGLQHYRLARDFEIAVIDGERGHGNGWLLPAGPLREPPSRLRAVDAIVINGLTAVSTAGPAPAYSMTLTGTTFCNLRDPARLCPADTWRDRPVHAVAGIGNPQRFFRHLEKLGLHVIPHPFPDHHDYRAADFDFARGVPVVMTEKDAVKCCPYAGDDWWVLPVTAEVDPALADRIVRTLDKR